MTPRYFRRLFWFLFLTGLGLAGYSYLAPPPGPALEVVQDDIEISDCGPGQQREVLLHLQNNSGQSVRVLGQAPC